MPTIIDRKALPEEVWAFLKKTEKEIEDDQLVVSREEEKLVIEPLTRWLKEGESAD